MADTLILTGDSDFWPAKLQENRFICSNLSQWPQEVNRGSMREALSYSRKVSLGWKGSPKRHRERGLWTRPGRGVWPHLSGKRVSPTLKESHGRIVIFLLPVVVRAQDLLKDEYACLTRPVPIRGITREVINWGAGPKKQHAVFCCRESCRSGEPPFGWAQGAAL